MLALVVTATISASLLLIGHCGPQLKDLHWIFFHRPVVSEASQHRVLSVNSGLTRAVNG